MSVHLILSIIILITNLATSYSFAELLKDINVIGNQRISKETIIVLGKIEVNSNYNDERLNTTLKELYNSNFFKDVKKNSRRTKSYSGDKTGKSKVTSISYHFDDRSSVGSMCYKWSKERLKINHKHRLSVSINTSKYLNWNVSWFKKFRK